MDCSSYVLCERINLQKLKEDLESKFECQKFHDAVAIVKDQKVSIVFNYGIVVFWGQGKDERLEILSTLRPYMINLVTERESENLSYSIGKEVSIKNDHITLVDDSVIEKLSFSHSIAQSLKLSEFELTIQRAIETTREIPKRVAKTGKTQLSRQEIAKMRGYLFIVRSELNLNYDLLDKPEFFWEYPELDANYRVSSAYLEVDSRLEVLNRKLEVIHELFSMLADEQSHKHSALLEWIIIILIAVEIVMTLIKEFVHY